MSQQIKKFVYGASSVVDVVKARAVRQALEAKLVNSPMSPELLRGRFGTEMGKFLHSADVRDVPLLLRFVESLMP